MPSLSSARAFIQFADQGISSLNNLAITVVIANVIGLDALGQFNLPFTVYIALLGLQRAAIIEPMMASHSTFLRSGALIWSGSISSIVAIGTVVIACLSGQHSLFAWAFTLPILLIFDTIRYINIQSDMNYINLLMDSLWLGGTGLAFLLPYVSEETVVAFWGMPALICILLWPLFGIRLHFTKQSLAYFRKGAAGISTGSLLESAIYQGLWQLPLATILTGFGAEVSGQYRASLTIMAPIGVVVSAWTILSYRKQRESGDPFYCYKLASYGCAAAGVYLVICTLAAPQISSTLFGAREFVSERMLFLVGLQLPLIALSSQLAVSLKLRKSARSILISRILATGFVFGPLVTGLANQSVWLVVGALPAGMAVFGFLLAGVHWAAVRATSTQGRHRAIEEVKA